MSSVSSTVLTRENKDIRVQEIDDARLASLIDSAKDSDILAEVGAVSIMRLSIGSANPIVIVNLLEADKHQLLTI